MSTSITMWLGVIFLALAVINITLQAWLWGFPMTGEHGTPSYRTTAPKRWRILHRLVGYSFATIYVDGRKLRSSPLQTNNDIFWKALARRQVGTSPKNASPPGPRSSDQPKTPAAN